MRDVRGSLREGEARERCKRRVVLSSVGSLALCVRLARRRGVRVPRMHGRRIQVRSFSWFALHPYLLRAPPELRGLAGPPQQASLPVLILILSSPQRRRGAAPKGSSPRANAGASRGPPAFPSRVPSRAAPPESGKRLPHRCGCAAVRQVPCTGRLRHDGGHPGGGRNVRVTFANSSCQALSLRAHLRMAGLRSANFEALPRTRARSRTQPYAVPWWAHYHVGRELRRGGWFWPLGF